jgi:DNA-binding transcriptional LysR family regulator
MAKLAVPRLSAIDLNLLVVYDAIMRERSVTKAGRQLGLSQPAMSHALARLRHMLKDELFVRSPNGMEPTPRAEQLSAPIRSALDGFREALQPEQFDPTEAKSTFTIAVDNYAAIVLVPKIVSAISQAAPMVRLDFRPSGTIDVLDHLDRNELQLSIGSSEAPGERFSRRLIAEDRFVAVLRKRHPAARSREMDPQALSTLPFLQISSAKFGTESDSFENGARSAKRTPEVRAPFLSAAAILEGSDLVSILPLKVAQALVKTHDLCFRPLSRPPRPVQSAMTWLRRLDNQPAHGWLRSTINHALSTK